MLEEQPCDQRNDALSLEFLGEHIYTQTSAISKRLAEQHPPYGKREFSRGTEVCYQLLDLENMDQGQKKQVAQILYDQLEAPSFLPQSKEMPYTVDTFQEIMAIKDGALFLAWKNDKSLNTQKLVGYLFGAPYKNYSQDYKDEIISQATKNDSDPNVVLPDDSTVMFDTFAVLASERGQKIGDSLLHLLISKFLYPGSGFDKLATFAVDHKTAQTRTMVKKLGGDLIADEPIAYRGITAHYMLVCMKENK